MTRGIRAASGSAPRPHPGKSASRTAPRCPKRFSDRSPAADGDAPAGGLDAAGGWLAAPLVGEGVAVLLLQAETRKMAEAAMTSNRLGRIPSPPPGGRDRARPVAPVPRLRARTLRRPVKYDEGAHSGGKGTGRGSPDELDLQDFTDGAMRVAADLIEQPSRSLHAGLEQRLTNCGESQERRSRDRRTPRSTAGSEPGARRHAPPRVPRAPGCHSHTRWPWAGRPARAAVAPAPWPASGLARRSPCTQPAGQARRTATPSERLGVADGWQGS